MDRPEDCAPRQALAPQTSGQQFGRYFLLRRLGAGGMAEVFLAREPLPGGLSKILVLKKIRPAYARAPAFQRMFEEEAKIAVNLNHPCVVQTFGYGHIGDVFYLTMEHVDGLDLLRLLQRSRERAHPLQPTMAAYILGQVCQGLDYAHRKQDEQGEPLSIVHRDVSPQNVLLSWDGAVKLADFGIARARDTQEDDGLLKGKYAYMSPEQAAGEPVDRRSDLFSAGVVLWETITGQALFGALPMRDALAAIRAGKAPRPGEVCAGVPPELDEITMRALRTRPEERYQTARDLHRDLSRFFFSESVRRGDIVDSGRLAAYIAQLVPPPQRPPLLGALEEIEAEEVTGSVPRRPRDEAQGPLRERRGVFLIEGTVRGGARPEALRALLREAEEAARRHRALPRRLDSGGLTLLIGLPQEEEHDAAQAIQLARELIDAGAAAGAPLALAVHRGAALLWRRPGPPAAGERSFEYELLPEATEVAHGLLRSAQAGEIVVGSGVYRAVRGSWQFLALETVAPGVPAAGGEPAVTRAYRLLASAPRGEAAPRAPMLVGRAAELSMLHEALAESGAGRTQCVLVLGEAGIGKRTLLAAFRRSLDPRQFLALHAAAPSGRRGCAWALVSDLGRDLLGLGEHADAEEDERHLQAAAAVLAPSPEAGAILGALRQLLHAQDAPGTDPGAAARVLLRGLRGLRGARTVVLTVAELQWADAPSLRLLDELLTEGLVDLCACAGRPIGDWPDELRALLRRGPAPRLIELRGLSAEEQEELILSRLSPESRPEAEPLCRRLISRAEGNPLYLSELIDSLVERGALVAGPSGLLCTVDRDAEPGVPAAVEAILATRLDRLPEEQRACLVRLSICQRGAAGVDPALLGALLGRDPTAELIALAEAGLVVRAAAGAWSVRSPLLQEVIAATLAPEDRRHLQEQVLLLLASEVQTHIARTEIARAARLP